MKKGTFLLRIFATLSVFILTACEKTTLETTKPEINKAVSETSGFADIQIKSNFAKFIDNNKKLQVSTTNQKSYQTFAATKKGFLKPDTSYLITFDANISKAPTNKDFLHIIARDLGTVYPHGDIYRNNLYFNNNRTVVVRIKIRTPKDPKNYAIQFITHGNIDATISNFKAIEGANENFYRATEDALKYAGDLGKLPSGAKDFKIDSPKPVKEIVVNAADFGLNEKIENSATIINKALEHCKKIGASKLILPKGNYKIFETTGILIDGFTDFTFDGGGSTFIYRKENGQANMLVKNCLRSKICNFNFDWDWETEPLSAIVEVIDVKNDPKDAGNNYMDLKFVEYDKYPQYNKKIRISNLSSYDPVLKAVGYEGGRGIGFGFSPSSSSPKVQWLSPNTIRLYYSDSNKGFKKGIFFRTQAYYYGINGLVIDNNQHQTLENINIYSCKGHGMVCAGKQKYFKLENVNIVLPKGVDKRPLTTTADHFHFVSSNGFFKMNNCEFSFGSDDCINIHDCSGFGYKIGSHTLQLIDRTPLPSVGDPIELRDSFYFPTNYKSKVKKAYVKDKVKYVDFEDELPEQKTEGFVVFNWKNDSSNIFITNSYFHSNRARGLLILARNVTIENCKFYHNEMGALKFETGFTLKSWCEGFGVDNIVVRNCTFDMSNPLGVTNQGRERDIFMGVYLRQDPSSEQTTYPIISNILFENNHFKDTYGLVAFIASTGNVIFKDNVFENPSERKNPHDYRGAFFVTSSSNTKIVNNTYIKSKNVPNPGVYSDIDNVKNIVVAGNRVIEKK